MNEEDILAQNDYSYKEFGLSDFDLMDTRWHWCSC
jgi:hypothetical protein